MERAMIRAGEGGVLTADLLDLPQPAEPADPEPSHMVVAGPATPNEPKVISEIRSLKAVEKEMISEALTFYRGNIQQASAKLGIGRNTFYRKMKEYGISL
jgi:transcriptional regulator of acetoin/glycerol metabolism